MGEQRLIMRAAIAVAVIGAVSVGVIGIASATDERAAAQPSAEPAPDKDSDGHGWWGHWGGGERWGMFGGVEDMLHGEVVMATDSGTKTMLVQKGAVTSVSPTSVAVTSTDGHAATYTLNADTKVNGGHDDLTELAQNDEIVVIAPKSETPTATTILDWD